MKGSHITEKFLRGFGPVFLRILLCFCLFVSCKVFSEDGASVRLEGAYANHGLGMLLVNLDQGGRLKWQAFDMDEGASSIEDLLVRINGWPNGSGSSLIDGLVCQHNPHVCCPYTKTSLSGKKTQCLNELRKSKAGSKISYRLKEMHSNCKENLNRSVWNTKNENCEMVLGVWTKPAKGETVKACGNRMASKWSICLPMIAVRERGGFNEYKLDDVSDEGVRRKYSAVQGCDLMANKNKVRECEESFSEDLLNRINTGGYRSALNAKKIILPTRAFFVEIPSSGALDNRERLENLLVLTGKAIAQNEWNASINYDWILASGIKPQGSVSEPQVRDSEGCESEPETPGYALRKMGVDDFIDEVQNVAPILVFENTPLAKDNSRLAGSNIFSYLSYEHVTKLSEKPNSGFVTFEDFSELSGKYSDNLDLSHASNVVSVLAANKSSASEVTGVMDSLSIGYNIYGVYFAVEDKNPDIYKMSYQVALQKPIFKFRACCKKDKFPIVNISMKLSSEPSLGPDNTVPEGVLFGKDIDAQYTKDALFVVASGNPDEAYNCKGGHGLTTCDHSPGCKSQKTENMVSVVALDSNGEKASRYSYSGTVFEVAAIGEVKSLDYSGNDRNVQGSSIAAPFASALAALIVGEADYSALTPADVKRQILHSVDFLNNEKVVEFGRINFSRALNIHDDILIIKEGKLSDHVPAKAAFCGGKNGCYTGLVEKSNIKVVVTGGVDSKGDPIGAQKPIEFDKVLRLVRAGEKWNIIYIAEKLKRIDRTVLLRRVGVRLVDENENPAELRFLVNGETRDAVELVRLENLLDYSRCMWVNTQDGNCLRKEL